MCILIYTSYQHLLHILMESFFAKRPFLSLFTFLKCKKTRWEVGQKTRGRVLYILFYILHSKISENAKLIVFRLIIDRKLKLG